MTIIPDWRTDVSMGDVGRLTIVNKFGRNPDIDTGTVPEDVWEGGGLYTGFPLTDAETIDVFSSSANDTSGGSGARTVQLQGLDADWLYQEETVTLSGVTPVTTQNTWRRMNRVEVLTVGATQVNEGAITCRHTTTTSNVFAVCQAGIGGTHIAAYTVPGNAQFAFLEKVYASCRRGNATGDRDASIDYFIRPPGGSWRSKRPAHTSDGANFVTDFYGAIRLEARTDVVMRVTLVSNDNLDVSGGFDILVLT